MGEIIRQSLEGEDISAVPGVILDRLASEVLVQFPVALEILSAAARDDTIKQIARDDRETAITIIESSIQRQIDKGVITNKVEVHTLSRIFLGCCWDVVIQLLMGCDQAVVSENWKQSVTALFNLSED
jgi:hypothetical protein